jgi:hypothetical protein
MTNEAVMLVNLKSITYLDFPTLLQDSLLCFCTYHVSDVTDAFIWRESDVTFI